MTESPQKPNWFVRVLIIVFSTILVWMVYASFTKSSSPFTINAGLISLIAIITIVILSESFNNLSVGQLISISRQKEKVEKDNEKLSKENANLNLQIVQMAQIVTNFRQTQVSSNTPINITNFDIAQLLGQKLGVVQVNQEEKISAEEDVIIEAPKDTRPEETRRQDPRIRREIYRKLEEISLNKYIERNNLPVLDFQKDVRFSEAFEKIDPIMDKGIIFDGYLSLTSKEYFFEVKIGSSTSPIYWDRLYIMLAKILFYRQAKNIQADLTLINVEIPDEIDIRPYYPAERLFTAFQPAIANNLLKIETVKFSKKEYEEVVKTVMAENPQNAA